MKAPEIVTKATVYYEIIYWKYRNYPGKTLPVVYPDIGKAFDVFKRLVEHGRFWGVTIRKEEVWKRDPETEISASTPIAMYEDNYDFADFIMDMEGAKTYA